MTAPTQGRAAEPAGDADALLDTLSQIATRGGERDAESLGRFGDGVLALRALPDASGPFQMKVASAGAWAALLFSSWRHRKYDRPDETGASRVRAFITQDLAQARRMRAGAGREATGAPPA
jgi:hypothetical protein